MSLDLRQLKNQKGSVIVMTAILLPILILIMGIVLDYGWALYSKMHLNMATEAAVSTVFKAVDVEQSVAEARIILKPDEVLHLSNLWLKKNYPDATIVSCDIENDNTVRLNTRVLVKTVFVRIVGIETIEVRSSVKATMTYSGG